MSGAKFLLDTNLVIGLVKAYPAVVSMAQVKSISLDECAYSFITRIELLSYSAITKEEIQATTEILNQMSYLAMSKAIENMTIAIRRQFKLKTPDAIIAATAKLEDLELLTLDQQLLNHAIDIKNLSINNSFVLE